jgi:hypothetical protein
VKIALNKKLTNCNNETSAKKKKEKGKAATIDSINSPVKDVK